MNEPYYSPVSQNQRDLGHPASAVTFVSQLFEILDR